MPFRPRVIEESLRGKTKSDQHIRAAIEGILEDIKRISGVRPSFVYKIPVVRKIFNEDTEGLME